MGKEEFLQPAPSQKSRVLLLVDINAFFISCEISRDPSLREVPAAVAGDPLTRRGIILAANYPARAFGVQTAMTVSQAQNLCPNLQLIAPDPFFYRACSANMIEFLTRFTPCIEPNSIDEAFLDMTGTERLWGTPLEGAHRIQNGMLEALGLGCSIGIAPTKFLAKMAADMKKPLGITELSLSDLPERLWPLPVLQMQGIGEKTAQKLNQIGIFTIGQLAKSSLAGVERALGRQAFGWIQKAQGKSSAVVGHLSNVKRQSISREITLPEDLKDKKDMAPIVRRLSLEVAEKVRRQGYQAGSIQLIVKYADFTKITRRCSLNPPDDGYAKIRQAALGLLERTVLSQPVRLLGIGASELQKEDPRQISWLEDPFSKRLGALDDTLDQIRSRFGEQAATLGIADRPNPAEKGF